MRKMNCKRALICIVLCSFSMVAKTDQAALSEEFLEFLMDFEQIDEDSYDMVIENGKRDAMLEDTQNEVKHKQNVQSSSSSEGKR